VNEELDEGLLEEARRAAAGREGVRQAQQRRGRHHARHRPRALHARLAPETRQPGVPQRRQQLLHVRMRHKLETQYTQFERLDLPPV